MRQLGTLPTAKQAERFHDYLVAQKIDSRTEPADGEWEIWVFEEDLLAAAREHLLKFRENPEAAEFVKASQSAKKIREEREQKAVQAIRRHQQAQKQWTITPTRDLPITLLLIVTSIIVTLTITLQEGRGSGLINELSITNYQPSGLEHIVFQPGLREIQQGEVWRLITPIFIHFGPFHLLMNMWITYQFGFLIESRLKWWRFLFLVLACAIFSNWAQYMTSGPAFGGMSGVDFGLFGFLWFKGVFEPERGMGLRSDFVYFMLGFMFLCFTGIVGPIANTAHVGGLIAGCSIAVVRPLIRQALR